MSPDIFLITCQIGLINQCLGNTYGDSNYVDVSI